MMTNTMRERDRQTDRETETETERDRERERNRQRDRERERERESSELYYTRIKILDSCLFLQSVVANLHVSRLHIKQQ